MLETGASSVRDRKECKRSALGAREGAIVKMSTDETDRSLALNATDFKKVDRSCMRMPDKLGAENNSYSDVQGQSHDKSESETTYVCQTGRNTPWIV